MLVEIMGGQLGMLLTVQASAARELVEIAARLHRNKQMKRQAKMMARQQEPESAFLCEHCNQCIPGAASGTQHRNHCPHCLWSLHVDSGVGDRRAGCKGHMEPIAIWVQPNGEWSIVHRCKRCNVTRVNRIAGDDNEVALLSIAVRPLAQPAFPLDGVAVTARPRAIPKPVVQEVQVNA